MAKKFDNRTVNSQGRYTDDGDDDLFVNPQGRLKPGSDPWKASASGHGYNAKFSDDDGWKRGEQSRGGSQAWESRGADDSAFLLPSQSETNFDLPHEKLAGLIDDSQPYDPMLPGGAGLTHGKDVGDGKVRYKPKTGALRKQSNDGL